MGRNTSVVLALAGLLAVSATWAGEGTSPSSSLSGQWLVRGIYMDPTASNNQFHLNSGEYAELSGAIRIGTRWSAALALGIPTSFQVRDPAYQESFRLMLNTVTLKFDLASRGPLRPYLGIGVGLVPVTYHITDRYAGLHFGHLTASAVLQTGVDLLLTEHLFVNADLRFLPGLDPNYTAAGGGSGHASIDPLLLGFGIGARF